MGCRTRIATYLLVITLLVGFAVSAFARGQGGGELTAQVVDTIGLFAANRSI